MQSPALPEEEGGVLARGRINHHNKPCNYPRRTDWAGRIAGSSGGVVRLRLMEGSKMWHQWALFSFGGKV